MGSWLGTLMRATFLLCQPGGCVPGCPHGHRGDTALCEVQALNCVFRDTGCSPKPRGPHGCLQ